MLDGALEALAASAGTAVVAAMVTDGWQETRTRVARLLSRGDAQDEPRQLARLERARTELTAASDEQAERVRLDQLAAWRTRFADLLDDAPQEEEQVRGLVEFLAGRTPANVAETVQVTATASGKARQAVQGQGVQHNTFTQSQ